MTKQKKVILITGASSGIGYDAAMILAGQGYKVYSSGPLVGWSDALILYLCAQLITKLNIYGKQRLTEPA